jgi:hypothetical protein
VNRFECSTCGEAYEVDDSLGGKAIRCRNCHEWARLPKAKGEAPPPPPPRRRPPREPWFYPFLEQATVVSIALGGIACLPGFTLVATKARGAEGAVAAVVALFIFGLAFVSVLVSAALVFVVVDAGRSLRRLAHRMDPSREGFPRPSPRGPN